MNIFEKAATKSCDVLKAFSYRKIGYTILKRLHTSTEDFATSIATAGELGVVAVAAIDLVQLATKLFVHQRHSALIAEEAGFMPMLVLI